jgi:hypothetical protein
MKPFFPEICVIILLSLMGVILQCNGTNRNQSGNLEFNVYTIGSQAFLGRKMKKRSAADFSGLSRRAQYNEEQAKTRILNSQTSRRMR